MHVVPPAVDQLATSILQRRIQRLEVEVEKMRAELAAPDHSPEKSVSSARRVAARLGGLARARTAWRYFDGTFMPESEKAEAYREEYERYAAGGCARARSALRNCDGTFLPKKEVDDG